MARRRLRERLTEHRFGEGHKQVRAWEFARVTAGIDDDANQPDFVLLHGLGVSSRYFVPLAEELAAFGRVFVFDLPGFGGVPHPSDPMTIEDFAATVRVALAEFGVERPVLVGHSMGAQVAVELVVQAPEHGGAVVLVGPIVCPDQRQRRTVLRAFLRSVAHERVPAALRSVQGYVRAAPRWVVEVFPAMMQYPIETKVAGLRGRVAILRGAQDRLCPDHWADRLAAAASGAQVQVATVEGAAHQVVVDHARVVVAAALDVAGVGNQLP